MSKPKKRTLKDGRIVWEVVGREGGRESRSVKRRFDSSKAASEYLQEFRNQKKMIRNGALSGSFHKTTFREESQNWLDNLKLRCTPGHFRRCVDVIKDFNSRYGGLEPNKITPDFMTFIQRDLKDRAGRKAETTYSNASINRYTEAVCAVIRFAFAQRRIPYNSVAGFRKLPRNSPEMLFWEEIEARAFLAWADGKYKDLDSTVVRTARKNYVVYLLALNTGMRAGEIWGLKPRDLSFSTTGEGDTIFVRRQYHGMEKKFAPLKGSIRTGKDKSRHVPCSPMLRQELEALIEFNKTEIDQTVFHSVAGEPVQHDSFVGKFHRDIGHWKGRRIRFHDLRHTAATLMLSKGVDIKTVSEIMGHENISTTMLYVHLLGNQIKKVSKTFSIVPTESHPATNSQK